MATNPMEQFKVHKIGPEIEISGINLSFTNASLFMVISAGLILILLLFGTREKKLVPGKIQLISEMLYNFIAKMISDTAGKKAKPFFPFIFSLFVFILFCNMVGMLPYSFTVTSHIIVTLTFALFIFVGVTILGFVMHGFKYLKIGNDIEVSDRNDDVWNTYYEKYLCVRWVSFRLKKNLRGEC